MREMWNGISRLKNEQTHSMFVHFVVVAFTFNVIVYILMFSLCICLPFASCLYNTSNQTNLGLKDFFLCEYFDKMQNKFNKYSNIIQNKTK